MGAVASFVSFCVIDGVVILRITPICAVGGGFEAHPIGLSSRDLAIVMNRVVIERDTLVDRSRGLRLPDVCSIT